MKTSENISEITIALLRVQKKIEAAKKSSSNPYFQSKYANLTSVMDACKELLNSEGILILQPVGKDEFGDYVETVLFHTLSKEYVSDRLRLVGTSDMQKLGAAITYARRFSLQSMLFMDAEDDDGETAVGRGDKVHKPIGVSDLKSQIQSLLRDLNDPEITKVVTAVVDKNGEDESELKKYVKRLTQKLEEKKNAVNR